MAATKKSTTNAKQIMDVAHPGKSAPSSTSKPVIVTNRPVLQDPMVVTTPETDSPGETKTEASQPITVHKSGGLVLQPLNDKTATEDDTVTALDSPEDAAADTAEISLPLDDILKRNKTDDGTDTNKDTPEEMPENTAEPEHEPAEDTSMDNDKTEPESAVPASNDKSTAEPSVKPEEQSKPAGNQPAATEKPEPTKLSPVAATAGVPTKDGALIDENDVDQKAAEHDAKIEKLVETKQYFLPVDAVEKRRTKRVIVLGVLLAVILAAAWLDIALDAGILQLGSIHAVTNFF